MDKIEERLEKLGMKQAAAKVAELRERKRKMMIAYENYRYVRPEKIKEFNQKLWNERVKGSGEFKELIFTSLDQYAETPPDSVLDALETAIGRNCFDVFEVAHIVTRVPTPDPILFGRIHGCPDRFFIGQWDNDVKIEDILKDNEG